MQSALNACVDVPSLVTVEVLVMVNFQSQEKVLLAR